MESNIWFSKELMGIIDEQLEKTRDRIPAQLPAQYGGKEGAQEGFLMLGLRQKEIQEILKNDVERVQDVNVRIQGTSLIVDVIAIKSKKTIIA